MVKKQSPLSDETSFSIADDTCCTILKHALQGSNSIGFLLGTKNNVISKAVPISKYPVIGASFEVALKLTLNYINHLNDESQNKLELLAIYIVGSNAIRKENAMDLIIELTKKYSKTHNLGHCFVNLSGQKPSFDLTLCNNNLNQKELSVEASVDVLNEVCNYIKNSYKEGFIGDIEMMLLGGSILPGAYYSLQSC